MTPSRPCSLLQVELFSPPKLQFRREDHKVNKNVSNFLDKYYRLPFFFGSFGHAFSSAVTLDQRALEHNLRCNAPMDA